MRRGRACTGPANRLAAVLIVLPPSESKAPPRRRGGPIDLDTLSFPELTPLRTTVLEALVATSVRRDARSRLLVGAPLAGEVEWNTRLDTLPTRPAIETYRGPLFAALDQPSLSSAAKRRASSQVVIVSSLWGTLRPNDRIPPYRLNICADLVGLGALEPLWRGVLGPVLAAAAGSRGVVVDCRSSSYRAVGTSQGMDDRTVTLRVVGAGDRRGAPGHVAKRVRGEVVRHLLESGANPRQPEHLATAVADRWDVVLTPPERSGHPWTMDVIAPG